MNLVVGAGNILLSDEGIGIHLVQDLERENIFEDTSYADIGTSSLDISSYIDDRTEKLVLIDCIRTESFPPGTVFRLSVDDLRKRQARNFSLHQIELVDSIKLNSLDSGIPPTIVIGIAPADIGTFSMELSDALKAKYPDILSKVKKIISDFLFKDA